LAERGGFEPPSPFRLWAAENSASSAHYFVKLLRKPLTENIFAIGSTPFKPIRVPPIVLTKHLEAVETETEATVLTCLRSRPVVRNATSFSIELR
jgi:hypothetical protein